MPQFIVEADDVDPARACAVLRGPEARHLCSVLRSAPGDPLAVTDGCGRRWRGVFAEHGEDWVRLEQLRELPGNEAAVELELLQGLPKGERWELILEKGTELGGSAFRPVYTRHSIARVPEARLKKKMERWREKVRASLKQCERGRLPVLYPPVVLGSCLSSLPELRPDERRYYLAERTGGAVSPGASAPSGIRLVRLAVGPEGGWAPQERDELERSGFEPLSLGPRILRCDTAAIAGTALALQAS